MMETAHVTVQMASVGVTVQVSSVNGHRNMHKIQYQNLHILCTPTSLVLLLQHL